MLSGFCDRDTVIQAMSAGAVGFIPKAQSRDVLVHALQLIFAGGKYIPEDVLTEFGSLSGLATHVPHPIQNAVTQNGSLRRTPPQLGLTDRQIEVLALMMEGKSNKLICRALNLAEPTVKNHVSAILKVLGVTNRTEAVVAGGALDWSGHSSNRG
jgi:DNA-binding NarL/FixJ family response regulator